MGFNDVQRDLIEDPTGSPGIARNSTSSRGGRPEKTLSLCALVMDLTT